MNEREDKHKPELGQHSYIISDSIPDAGPGRYLQALDLKWLVLYFRRLVKDNNRIIKLGIFFFPLIFAILVIVLKWNHPWFYKVLIWQEDSIGEYITAIFYFLSCLISFSISVCFYKSRSKLQSLPYFVLTGCFFFIGMEEISWGQRLMGVATPEIFEKCNKQDEMNFHNLKGFPLHTLYIIVGLYGALARSLVPKSIIRKSKALVNYFIPDYYLIFYFLITAVLYLYYEYFSSVLVILLGDQFAWGYNHFVHGKDQEAAELLLSIGFFLFVIINKYRQLWNKDNIFLVTVHRK
jgi:hypothetical protein